MKRVYIDLLNSKSFANICRAFFIKLIYIGKLNKKFYVLQVEKHGNYIQILVEYYQGGVLLWKLKLLNLEKVPIKKLY